MKVKVSYREAVRKIDLLTRKGVELKEWMSNDYLEKYENSENKLKEQKKVKQEFEYSLLPITTDFVISNPEILTIYQKKFDSWFNECLQCMEDIFVDFIPIHRFKTAQHYSEKPTLSTNQGYEVFKEIHDLILGKLDILMSFYDELSGFVRVPLNYISDKSQIWFYDSMVQLTPDSNEAFICKYMFNYGIGEWIEFFDIIEKLFGHEVDIKTFNKKIKSAVTEVNRKTNSVFGFPILKIQQNKLVALTLPPNFIVAVS